MKDKIDEYADKILEYVKNDKEQIKHVMVVDEEGYALFGSAYITTMTLFTCSLSEVGLLDVDKFNEMRWFNARHMSSAYNN